MTQVNTPYPSTAYLCAYLESLNYPVSQDDLSLKLFLKVFSQKGMENLVKFGKSEKIKSSVLKNWFIQIKEHLPTLSPNIIHFLQGKNPSFALQILNTDLFKSPRFYQFGLSGVDKKEFLDWNFGVFGTGDQAKFIASLFIDDLGDLIRDMIDENFELAKYGEKIASSLHSLDPMLKELETRNYIVDFLEEITLEHLQKNTPSVVGLSIPFPGNLLGAMRIGSFIKTHFPKVKIIWGGGYINTELRTLKEERIFNFVDAICLDAGEKPFELCLKYFMENLDSSQLLRTYIVENKVLNFIKGNEKNVAFKDLPCPKYSSLPLSDYLSFIEMPNPMHRMWSEFRWNKMILAHGCYWKKCAFCDVNLDYINRFEPNTAEKIVDQMESIIKQTGSNGFHFVDEAAPPALLEKLSKEILKRKLLVTWWGNIRFDKYFTKEICLLLKQSGCIAVTGGLEVASERLLKLMNKGVSIPQVANVTKNFQGNGIKVHAYLMYGFPTQNEQETIDSLEFVRQLFKNGCLDSAYWHRFAATVHSPIGKNPENFGITLNPNLVRFAENDINFVDATPVDHDELGVGLKKALYNYMSGIGIEEKISFWFENKKIKTTVNPHFIQNCLN